MDVRVLLFVGAFCLQLCACASPEQTDQKALADAAIQNYFDNAACIQTHYEYESRHPHACAAAVKRQARAGLFGAWGRW